MNGLIEQLTELRLHGMAEAAKDILSQKSPMSLPEAMRQLIKAEACEREVRSIKNRPKIHMRLAWASPVCSLG